MFVSPFGTGPFSSAPTSTTVGPIGNKLPGGKEEVKFEKPASAFASFSTNAESLRSLATQPNLFAKETQPEVEAGAEAPAAPMVMPTFAPHFIPPYMPMFSPFWYNPAIFLPFGYNPAITAYPIVIPSTVAPPSPQAIPAALATRQIPFLPIQV